MLRFATKSAKKTLFVEQIFFKLLAPTTIRYCRLKLKTKKTCQ